MNYDSSILFGFYLYRRVIISNRIVSNDVTRHYIYCYHPLHILLSPVTYIVIAITYNGIFFTYILFISLSGRS